MEKELRVYINGEFHPQSEAKISVYDHGLLYGDGIFEGIRAYDGVVFKLDEHLDRLYRSAHAMMLKISLTKTEMKKAVLDTLKTNNLRHAYIRLVVTRGVGDLGLDPRKCSNPTIIIITTPLIQLHSEDRKKNGITAMVSWVKRDPVDATTHEIKSLNYLNSILAKIEANIASVDEAICLDKRGFVSEGVAENIFMVRNGEIRTPPTTTGALPGITREVVIRLAKRLRYAITERNMTPNELFNADEVFFTGTAAEIIPVREINKRVIGTGKTGPITQRLMKEFFKLTKDPKEGTLIP